MVMLMLSGPRFFFNGLRVWPNAAPTSAPGSFVWYAMTLGNRFTPVLTISDALYGVSEHREFYSYFKAGSYSSYRFRFLAASSSSSSLQAFEMQPLICALEPVNVISFAASSYTVYAKYQNVNIAPSINEFSSCTIQPALPTGLRLVALARAMTHCWACPRSTCSAWTGPSCRRPRGSTRWAVCMTAGRRRLAGRAL